jgi:hypothetical protein
MFQQVKRKSGISMNWIESHYMYAIVDRSHQSNQQPVVSNDLYKEIAAIKAQLLVLVSRLDRIEQEMLEH